MNYASDPFWAHKSGYSPERLQAYENQVMADRAAQERHRAEFDYAAMVGGALAVGTLFKTRAQRKQAKARRDYDRDHRPRDYARRNMEYHAALDRLKSESAIAMSRIEDEIARTEIRIPLAGTTKTHRTLKANLEALKAMLEDKRLAFETAREALSMKYHDILEYEAAMEAF